MSDSFPPSLRSLSSSSSSPPPASFEGNAVGIPGLGVPAPPGCCSPLVWVFGDINPTPWADTQSAVSIRQVFLPGCEKK